MMITAARTLLATSRRAGSCSRSLSSVPKKKGSNVHAGLLVISMLSVNGSMGYYMYTTDLEKQRKKDMYLAELHAQESRNDGEA